MTLLAEGSEATASLYFKRNVEYVERFKNYNQTEVLCQRIAI